MREGDSRVSFGKYVTVNEYSPEYGHGESLTSVERDEPGAGDKVLEPLEEEGSEEEGEGMESEGGGSSSSIVEQQQEQTCRDLLFTRRIVTPGVGTVQMLAPTSLTEPCLRMSWEQED